MNRLLRAASLLVMVVLLAHGTAQAQVIKKAPTPGLFKLKSSLKGVHPRLHFTAADIPAIRARGQGGGKFFIDRMKAAYGGYKGKPVTVTGTGDWKHYLYGLWGQLSMDLLWIVEQDASYADTAKSWALHYVRSSSHCSDAAACDDLVPQEIVTGIALTYDILYDRFTKSEQAEIRARLKAILDLQYQRFFVDQYWTNDFQNNHMHNRISGLGHAAIAILGDDPAVDVQKHADLAYHAYQLLRDWMPEDGSTHEGPGYWSYGYHWIARDEQLFEHATGVTPPAAGHDRELPYYRLYMLAPGMLNTYRVGDTGGSGPADNLEAMLPAVARFKNEPVHDFIKDQMKRNSDGFYQQVAWGLLWYDPAVATKPYTTLPLAHVWPDLDMLSARSGWDADDVGVVFKCGPPGGHLMQKKKVAGETAYINVAHSHPDQNSFLIWAHGKMLAVDDGYPKSPDTKLTASHNTLLIDGVGGPEEGTGWYQPFPYDQTAFTPDVVVSKATAYAGGDASKLYTHGQRFIRHFAFVEGRYVMIIDDLQGEGTGSHTFDWRLHSQETFTKSSDTAFKAGSGAASLDVRFLAPDAGALTSSFFPAAGTAAPGLSVKTSANQTQYLAVVVPQSGGAPAFTADKPAAQNGWAIRVKIDGKTDLFAAAAGAQQVTADDLTLDGRAALVRRQANALELALLARGTSLLIGGETILGADTAVNLVWRPDAAGGQLEVGPPYKEKVASALVEVGGLVAGATYCLTVDGVAAGGVTADASGAARMPAISVDKLRIVALAKGGSCAAAPDGGPGGDGAAGDGGGAAGDGPGGTTDAGAGADAGQGARRADDGCSCAVGRRGGAASAPAPALALLLVVGLLCRRARPLLLLALLALVASCPEETVSPRDGSAGREAAPPAETSPPADNGVEDGPVDAPEPLADSGGFDAPAPAPDGKPPAKDAKPPAPDTKPTPDTKPPAPDAPTGVGLAAKYPGDKGIDKDPDVVFAEDFEEGSVAQVVARYDDSKNQAGMTLVSTVPAKSSGKAALQMNAGGSATATDLYTRLLPGYDKLYVRYYVRYQGGVQWHHTGVWIGGYNPATAWPSPQAGIKPAGDDRFSVAIEPMGAGSNPGPRLDFYNYWMKMHSHNGVDYWGNTLIHQQGFQVENDTWMCLEIMVKVNPSPSSGAGAELAVWKNDALVQHFTDKAPLGYWIKDKFCPSGADDPSCTNYPPPPGTVLIPLDLQLRSTTALKINYFWPQNYITSGPAGNVTYDDMVIAKVRVGCLQ
jgi:hypothetical protein